MGITKGNSGEWSEPYVLLSLLSEGRIYDADANLNVIKDVWHDISSIIFKQDSKDKEEHRNKLGFSCVLVEKFLDKEG